MAIAAGVPLIPIYVRGAENVMPFGEWRVAPGKVRVTLGAPIVVTGSHEDRHAWVERLEQIARKELDIEPNDAPTRCRTGPSTTRR